MISQDTVNNVDALELTIATFNVPVLVTVTLHYNRLYNQASLFNQNIMRTSYINSLTIKAGNVSCDLIH